MFKNAYLALYNRYQIQDIKIHLQNLLQSQIIVKFKIFAILNASDLMIKFITSTISLLTYYAIIHQQKQYDLAAILYNRMYKHGGRKLCFRSIPVFPGTNGINFMKTDHEYYIW